MAIGQVVAKQPFDGFRHQRRRAAVPDWPRNRCVLAYGPAETEVIRVRQLPLVLDLLAFDANVRNPVLSAAIGTAGHMQAKLLVKLGQPLFKFADKPAREALGLGNRQLAELCACARDCAAKER
jgi:hypothetical protein